ncbi:MAG: uroporphyrinogen decarboxylase [Firmicutes bacterium]|nr:uroporphyrinogen decarboxylase [Bacillota bacterium]
MTVEDRKTLFLSACRGEPVERVPVWMMRQAGRYLPEYRAIRAKYSFLDVCKTPELAVEVSLQPYRRLGVDTVIVFSDILIPAEAMGLALELSDHGPVLPAPVRSFADLTRLHDFDPETETGFLMETLRQLVRETDGRVPVLGFAGAPWTVACYLVEGQTKAGFATIKQMLYAEPGLLQALLDRVARNTARYLQAQIAAGATAVQLFDTWAGELAREEFDAFALPALRRLIEELRADPRARTAPVILYLKAAHHLLESAVQAGADVLSLDWRVDLAEARQRWPHLALQGNVDPCVLLGPREKIEAAVRAAVAKTGGAGHILNLGHGILPQTPVENALAFVRAGQQAPVAAWTPMARSRADV